MIRTQVSFEDNMYKLVQVYSKELGISIAEFVRRAIAKSLPKRDKTTKPWIKYLGCIDSKDPYSSQSVDEIVYNRPHP